MEGDRFVTIGHLRSMARKRVTWRIAFQKPGPVELHLRLRMPDHPLCDATFQGTVTPSVPRRSVDYVPPPQPVNTGDMLIGAMHCPLWKQGTRAS